MYDIYRFYEFFQSDRWPGYFEIPSEVMNYFFPSLDGLNYDLIPLFDAFWDVLQEALLKNPSFFRVTSSCRIDGPIETKGCTFKGNGILAEVEGEQLICVTPEIMNMNVYPEDQPFFMHNALYFISDDKNAVKNFLEKFFEFAKTLKLESLLDEAWQKLTEGYLEFEHTGGEFGFNFDYNDDLRILYSNHLNKQSGRHVC
jgi:hypothetical protein